MALRSQSLFLYGLEVTAENRYISFAADAAENPPDERTAVLTVGFYSLSGLAVEVERALNAADPTNIYAVTIDRNVAAGLQNRVTIESNGTYFRLFFSSGNPSNPALLLGFEEIDYTGALSYTGTSSCGTVLIPDQIGYNFIPISAMIKNQGVVNIAASGLKEVVSWSITKFWQVQFKYIPQEDLEPIWEPFIEWMVAGRELEFTPNITEPDLVYSGTLEEPAKGLDLTLTEMLPQFPFLFQTPTMKFRLRVND